MFAEERQQAILQRLREEGRVLAKALAESLGVSADTIRRDLIALEKKGFLKRTHGGAIPGKKVRSGPLSPALRYSEGSAAEKAIAKKAAGLIGRDDTVFIGSARLHYVMLDELPTSYHFTVVTNSTVIAEKLKVRENIDTYVVGGRLRPSGTIADAIAVDFLRGLRLDICFLTGGGLSAEHGVSTATGDVAVLHRTAAEVARRVICLATHDRLGSEMFARIIPIQEVDVILTDADAPEDEIQLLRETGAEVIVVDPEKAGLEA